MRSINTFLTFTFLALFGFIQTSNAQVLYYEDFENTNGQMPSDIQVFDIDGNNPDANVAIFGEWIVFPSLVADGTEFDTAAIVTSWVDGNFTADDWLVTPKIGGLGQDAILSWEAAATDPDFADGYEVYATDTGSEPDSFLMNGILLFSVAEENVGMTFHSVDLSGFSGDSIWIAFRNNSTDKFLLLVDDIKVENACAAALGHVANVACAGSETGSISVAASDTNVVSPTTFTYSWDNGATTAELTDLAAGTYSVTISGQNGCAITRSYEVLELGDSLETDGFVVDVDCNGGLDGEILLDVFGGVAEAGYTYAWSDGSTDQDLADVGAGVYSVVVSDDFGCEIMDTFEIVEPTAFAWSADSTMASAPGATDGAIDLTVSGGTAPYTFAWSNGATTEDISGLGAGTYTVTITDDNDCEYSGSVIIYDGSVNVITLGKEGFATEVFPNPTTGIATLNVASGVATDINIEVVNITGQVLVSINDTQVENNQYTLDLNQYPAGTYLIRVQTADKTIVQKLFLK